MLYLHCAPVFCIWAPLEKNTININNKFEIIYGEYKMSEIKSMVEYYDFREAVQKQHTRLVQYHTKTEVFITRAGEKISLGVGLWDCYESIRGFDLSEYPGFHYQYYYHDRFRSNTCTVFKFNEFTYTVFVDDGCFFVEICFSDERFNSTHLYYSDYEMTNVINTNDAVSLHELLDPIFDSIYTEKLAEQERLKKEQERIKQEKAEQALKNAHFEKPCDYTECITNDADVFDRLGSQLRCELKKSKLLSLLFRDYLK